MEDFSQQSAAVVQYVGYPYPHFVLQQQQQEEGEMQVFWNNQLEEIEKQRDFKHHQFPLSRTKRIMKSNPNVLKISAEAPILFAKACELLTGELTLRAWIHAQGNQRQLLQKKDLADAIRQNEVFDFLVKIVPRDEINEGATGFGPGTVGSTVSGVPNYFPPMGQPAVPGVIIGSPAMPGVIIGSPAMPLVAPPVYVQPWLPAWQAVENNPYATGGNSGQGNLDNQS